MADYFRYSTDSSPSPPDDTVDAQWVLREMTQACYRSYSFHSITIQMERQADLKPDCTLCEDPVK